MLSERDVGHHFALNFQEFRFLISAQTREVHLFVHDVESLQRWRVAFPPNVIQNTDVVPVCS